MLSSLCRSLSSACSVSAVARSTATLQVRAAVAAPRELQRQDFSSMAQKNEEEDFVSVLKLNMLQDNPGAVKKVSDSK